MQSSLNLVYMFSSWDSEEDSSGPGPVRGSGKIAGGNEQLPLAIARSLPEGSIHLNHQLVALKRNAMIHSRCPS